MNTLIGLWLVAGTASAIWFCEWLRKHNPKMIRERQLLFAVGVIFVVALGPISILCRLGSWLYWRARGYRPGLLDKWGNRPPAT